MPHILQRSMDGHRRDVLVSSEILIGHVGPVLQFHPLRQNAPYSAAGADTHPRRGELAEPEQVEHGFTV